MAERTKTTPRNAEATQARILKAAAHEFSKYGLAGARTDRIASRARANKQLLYRYFGSKAKLFEAVLQTQLGQRKSQAEATVGMSLRDQFLAWSRASRASPQWTRLRMWEALEISPGKKLPSEEIRAEQLRATRRQFPSSRSEARGPEGDWPLQLALMALASLPETFPNLCKLVSGLDPKSEAFVKEWEAEAAKFAVGLVDQAEVENAGMKS